MFDQEQSAGTKVFNCDLTRSKIFKSLYIQTKGKDDGDGRYLDDKEDLRNLALSAKVAFHDAIKYLWKDVTLHQINTMYRQKANVVSLMALYNASFARFLIIRPLVFNSWDVGTYDNLFEIRAIAHYTRWIAQLHTLWIAFFASCRRISAECAYLPSIQQ
jgi:hypothetical protein